jgi:hypothetical protein
MPPRKKNVVLEIPSSPAEDGPEVPEQPKGKAKRESKKSTKHKVVAVVTPDGIQGSFQSELRRPLIAHLPIHSNDIQFHDQPFVYDPRPPPANVEAFNQGDVDPFSEEATYEPAPKQESDEQSIEKKDSIKETSIRVEEKVSPQNHTIQVSRKEYGPTTLLVQFANTKHTQELPAETDLACFWCCDSFKGRPCVIPLRIVDSVWHVYGNFCTPQCCMAYLLSELLDTHTRWERISLLNRLYRMNTNGRIYPAPSRESLQRFGGPIVIEDFRALCQSQRVRVDIHLPPMVSILASMDTKPIDFYETPLRNTFASPYQYAPIKQSDEYQPLKLKRSKPLKDKESTLDACLNITMKVS